MLRFFFKKQLQIESLIYDYLDNLKMTQQHFSEALNSCLKNGISGDFDFLTKQTHKFESKADDLREEIKALMYGKALIGFGPTKVPKVSQLFGKRVYYQNVRGI